MLYQLSYASPKQPVPDLLRTHECVRNQGVQNQILAWAKVPRKCEQQQYFTLAAAYHTNCKAMLFSLAGIANNTTTPLYSNDSIADRFAKHGAVGQTPYPAIAFEV
jgi:hypothetical protein